MFLVISVYFNVRNILPKSGTFPPGYPVCVCVYVYIYIYIYIYIYCIPAFGPPCIYMQVVKIMVCSSSFQPGIVELGIIQFVLILFILILSCVKY